MRRLILLPLLCLSLPQAPIVAGVTETFKIVVMGPELAAPIEITGATASVFQVWAGPGVRRNGIEQTEGFIIEWLKGPVAEPPARLKRYTVLFFAPFREATPHVVYTVTYAQDPASGRGAVYLPGKGDDRFKENSFNMNHGAQYEGRWFPATKAWDELMKPLLP